ncbi:MAG: hypothetical protein KJN59_13705 [Bacteroidia bacterium]|nr:hypothetical protein [Bacteroidia bacterium]
MMRLKFLFTMIFGLAVLTSYGQQRIQKTKESFNTSKDVVIDLNTSYTNIEIDTWNSNKVEVEAYVESDELSKDELREIAENWNVEIEGGNDLVTITTQGNYHYDFNFSFANEEASEALKELQLRLAEMPPVPEMPPMPDMPPMPEMNMEMPEMPELPELPELPEGMYSVNFDSKKYEQEGEAYLERWSKEYEEKYGKEFKDKMKTWAKEFSKIDFDSYSAEMEAWGEEFGEQFGEDYAKKMEAWGEEFGKRFDGEWAEKMEKWGEEFGESFGKDMEKWGEEFGQSFGKDMEKWGEEFAKDMEKWGKEFEEKYGDDMEKWGEEWEKRSAEREKRYEERQQERERRLEDRERELEERMADREARRAEMRERAFNGKNKVKRTLKIKMPKDAKLKMDVRHGELKFSSVIYDLKADLSHSKLAANSIDGRNTSINASYTLVDINDWRAGSLNLNFVDNANLNAAKTISLTSNSSNVNINSITDNAIIDGSFGDLIINSVSSTFNNLNIYLENSDASIQLPKTDYDLTFKGNRSKLNKKPTDKHVINNYPQGQNSSDKTILINARFSNVIMN